ncbi:nickel pincer cofactor biosynthesis protein LarC [Streptomyces sp. NBC_01198]|uniref:nickel pincer cofactor biosynthesis protein LarC n=1 Tax=Streptomyces sp. NBC_01198 TaxID=2903769 RepID=UPI002E1349DB|nr:nickel pincer cofactor biosynthesis protein LarC [Streptomyces sp. NBC_01198]
MRTLWVDPANGAAGDMLLAALLDAGAELAAVEAALGSLGVEAIRLELREVRRHGFRAAHAGVSTAESAARRGLDDVLDVIAGGELPPEVADFAEEVFRRLAAAEGRVHGIAAAQVHFHEVGALDAIADVVGCATALHSLGLLAPSVRRIVGPVAVGAGKVAGAHGTIPIPGPAVLELLTAAGAPIAAHPAAMELCTPTGAALLCALATGWGPPPALTPLAVGVGAGTADPRTHPNVLRVLVGESAGEPAHWATSALHRVDTTVDDLDPRIWPDLLDALRAAGAADAWCTPALTRKGRPAQLLSVLVDAERLDLVCGLVFEQTTTLGVRVSPVTRRSLPRDRVEVTVAGSRIGVKRGYLAGRIVTVQPEYDEAAAAARRAGLPLAAVLDEARLLGERAGPAAPAGG